MSTENPSEAPRAHACFRLDAGAPLDLSSDQDPLELWRRLSYRLVRNPGNLLAHSRRVLLCRRVGLRDRLPGALLDLDHAAAGRGHALRRRLLDAVAPALEPRELACFEALLDGSPPGTDGPPAPGRVLPSMTAARRTLDAPAADEP